MLDFIRNWLTKSVRVHNRGEPISALSELVYLIDRFIDGTMKYELEWDDFISWDNKSPVIEVIRYRIAVLEPLFFSSQIEERQKAVDLLVEERNKAAAICGIPPRPPERLSIQRD